ncbi:MAG TPA: HD domain-containing protein [Clostridiales bacterium]|nr:HD domain-containing protein [Clostridiales bacterium]
MCNNINNNDSSNNNYDLTSNIIIKKDMERFKKQLDFLIEIDKLKQVFRNTILMDASRLENDAEHMWHMAVGAMLFSEYSNNKDIHMLKVLKWY